MAQALLALLAGLAFWQTANIMFGTREPWDSDNYWSAYLIALALCAALGVFFRKNGSLMGAIFIFAQFPVMMANAAGVGGLMGLGLMILCVQSVPAMFAARLTGRLRDRASRS